MDSIGETLRSARHERKLSLEEAARVTKIKPDILERLEADEFASLASPAYTKGFLKIYADYLGLDSAGLVASYIQSQGGLRRQGLHLETEATLRARQRRDFSLPLVRVVAVVAGLTVLAVAITLGINWWNGRASRRTAAMPAPPATATAAAPATPVPRADFEAYYQPRSTPLPELIDAAK